MLAAERGTSRAGRMRARLRGLAGAGPARRLFWHGERIALAALVMWGLAGVAVLLRVLAG